MYCFHDSRGIDVFKLFKAHLMTETAVRRCLLKLVFLKLVSAIFHQIFIFHQVLALQKL